MNDAHEDRDRFYSDSNETRLLHSFHQAEEGKIIVKMMEELENMAEADDQ